MISLSIQKAGSLTAVKIHTESVETHEPTHFIILLDTSDSMNQEKKLEKVKTCIQLLMQVIQSTDYISLITFATDSKIHLQKVQADSLHRVQIETTVDNIRTDGWTNLSAGLSNLAKVLEGETLKTGIILLTDGHANKGMCDSTGLLTMVAGLRARFPTISISSIAYGTDHNASLLLKIAEQGGSSSFSIVNSIEDAATAIGDCLGGFMSILAQNAELHFPVGTKIRSKFPIVETDTGVFTKLGDIYGGTDTLILVEFPETSSKTRLTCTYCKNLEAFSLDNDTIEECVGRNKDIELTDIRLRISSLFRELRVGSDEPTILTEVERLEEILRDEFLAGPLCSMLVSELTNIRTVITNARHGYSVDHTILHQHEAYTSLGRGVTTSIPGARASAHHTEEDPCSTMSPFQNTIQRQIAATLRSMTQQVRDDDDM